MFDYTNDQKKEILDVMPGRRHDISAPNGRFIHRNETYIELVNLFYNNLRSFIGPLETYSHVSRIDQDFINVVKGALANAKVVVPQGFFRKDIIDGIDNYYNIHQCFLNRAYFSKELAYYLIIALNERAIEGFNYYHPVPDDFVNPFNTANRSLDLKDLIILPLGSSFVGSLHTKSDIPSSGLYSGIW